MKYKPGPRNSVHHRVSDMLCNASAARLTGTEPRQYDGLCQAPWYLPCLILSFEALCQPVPAKLPRSVQGSVQLFHVARHTRLLNVWWAPGTGIFLAFCVTFQVVLPRCPAQGQQVERCGTRTLLARSSSRHLPQDTSRADARTDQDV